MNNLTVFVAFSLLVVFASAQSNSFDFKPRAGVRVALGSAVVDTNKVNSVKYGIAENQTITGCEFVTHQVTGVQSNVGPYNSGSKFMVLVTSLEPLEVIFGTTNQNQSFAITTLEPAFVGASGTEAYYLCDNYPAGTTLEVLITAQTALASPATYNLEVTQYVSNIKTIPSDGTFAQSTGVINLLTEPPAPGDLPHVAGQNFVHYYHKLDTSLSESRGKLFVELSNWNWQALVGGDTTAYLCVAFDTIVMLDGGSPPAATPYLGDLDIVAAESPVVTGAECSIWCVSGEITQTTPELTLPLGICNDDSAIADPNFACGFPEDIWIGVISPSATNASTYDIKIGFIESTLVDVEDIPAGNGHVQGFLSGQSTCDNPDACEDYFDILPPTSSAVTQFGPFLAIELYAVNNGQAQFQIFDGHIVTDTCTGCTPSLGSCEVVGVGVKEYCTFVIHPCQYDRTVDYTLVVEAVNDPIVTDGLIEYALDTFVGSWPVETVTASSFNKPSFGTVKPNYYNHYQITFTADQIKASSYFQTELYTLHEEDALEFFWKFGGAAGRTTECFEYDGLCTTNSICGAHEDVKNTGHCRFLFVPCDVEELYEEYASTAFDYDPTTVTEPNFDGLKVAELQAGTYYFAVRGKDAPSFNVKHEYTYTITWSLQQEIHVFDGVPVPNAVYLLDYSQQYVFSLPKEELKYRLRVRTSFVFNGEVETILSCDAGFCACGGATESVLTGLRTIYNETAADPTWFDDPFFGYSSDIHFDPICRGCTDKIYITVRGVAGGNSTAAGDDWSKFEDKHKPIPYVLTVHVEPFSKEPIPILTASRAGYHHNDEIRRAMDYVDGATYYEEPYDGWSKYYKISFTNAEDFRNDAFFVDLTVVPGIAGIKSLLDFYFGSPSASLEITTMNHCIVHGVCFAGTYPGDSENFGKYWGSRDTDISQGSCRVALQPCHFDSCAANTCGPTVFSGDLPLPWLNVTYPTTEFDRNLEYYIAVRDISHFDSFGVGSASLFPRFVNDMTSLFFKLSLQIVEQTPLTLAVDKPVYGHVGAKQYVHFRYDVAKVPANSKLVFEMYQNHNDDETLIFYMNYWNGTGPEIWAGESYDCLGTECGRKCVLEHLGGADETNFCTFEVSPCELKGRTGTYFLSVSSGTLDYVWATNTFGVQDTDFTVSAQYVAPIELLGSAKTEGVERGLLRDGTSLYYSVTVPKLSSGVLGRILNLEVENVRFGDIAVTFSEETPQNQCGCITTHTDIIKAPVDIVDPDRHVLRRVPCEVTDISTFYITVTAVSEVGCNPVGFVLRAILDDITEIPIKLATDGTKNTTLTKSVLRFDSDLDKSVEINEFSVSPSEIVALTWTTNSPAGSVMIVDATQDPSGITIPVTLSPVKFSVPDSVASFLTFGPVADDSDCSTLGVVTKSLDADLGGEIFVNACDFPNSSTKWFLLFSGEDISENSGTITVRVRVIPPQNLVDVPATNNFNASGVESGPFEDATILTDELISLTRRVITSDSFGLSAGQQAVFEFTGVNSVEIYYGSECAFVCNANPCIVQVCENLAAKAWYFSIDQSGPTDSTVTRIAAPFTASTLQVASLRANSEMTFSLASDEWKYFNVKVSAGSNSAPAFLLQEGIGGVTYYLVDSPVFMPGVTLSANAILADDGSLLVGTCGGVAFDISQVVGQCCYDAVDVTFAAVGTVDNATLLLNTADLKGTTGSLTFGSTVSTKTVGGTSTPTAFKQGYFTFTVPADTGFYYEFNVTSDSTAHFYLGRSRAGTGDVFGSNFPDPTADPVVYTDYSVCYSEDSSLFDSVLSGTPWTGFVDPCVAGGDCNEGTWVLTVLPLSGDGQVQFTSKLVQVKSQAVKLTSSASVTLNSDLRDEVPAIDLYASHVYEFNNPNTNWKLPILNDPLYDPAVFLPPRLVFTIDNIREDNVPKTADDATTSFFLDTAEQCGTAVNDFESTCFADGVVPNNNTIRCAMDICELDCGSSFYLAAQRNEDVPVTFRYSTSTANPTESDLIDVQTVSVKNTVSKNWSNGKFSAVYFKTTFDLAPNSWVNIIIDNIKTDNAVPPTPLGALTLDRIMFDGTTCLDYTTGELDLCDTPLAVDSVCVVPTPEDERCSQATSDEFKYPVYYRVGYDSAVVPDFKFSFRITFEVQTVSPMVDSGSATTLKSGQSYEKMKYIPDGTWQFYTFNLSPDLGYDYFTFDVTPVNCFDGELEVYTSWGFDAVIHDWVRVQWPIFDDCAATVSVAGSLSAPLSSCHTFGGEYRVAIYAPEGTSIVDGGEIIYSITAKLNHVPHLDLTPYCPHAQVYDDKFIQRYEFLVDASNRGSLLSFHALSTDPEITNSYTMWISKNANPYPSPDIDSCGDWDDTVPGFYSVDFTSDDAVDYSVNIDVCDFENDVWYLYIVGPVIDPAVDYGAVSIWAEFETHYIPVEYLSGALNGVSWSASLAIGDHQTYKVVLNQTASDFILSASLSTPEGDCVEVPADCAFTLVYQTGSVGYAPIGTGTFPRDCDGCGVGCSDCAVTTCVGNDCCIPNTFTEYFFTVSSTSVNNTCPYVLEVSVSRPVPLEVGDELCVEHDFVEPGTVVALYSISAAAGLVEINYPPGALIVETVTLGCVAPVEKCPVDFKTFPCEVENDCGTVIFSLKAGDTGCGFTYSLTVSSKFTDDSGNPLPFVPIALGKAVVVDELAEVVGTFTVTTPVVFVNPEVGPYSYGTCSTDTCVGEQVVIFPVDGKPTQYYFESPAGLVLEATDAPQSLTASVLPVDFTKSDIQHFAVNLPTGVTGYTIVLSEFSNVAPGDLHFGFSSVHVPFTDCYCGYDASESLPASTTPCGSEVHYTVTCASGRTNWLSISNCEGVCGGSFKIKVIFEDVSEAPTLSGNHNTPYKVVDNDLSGCGVELPLAVVYSVNVTDILSVSLRNAPANTLISVGPVCDPAVVPDSCVVGGSNPEYATYSCRVDEPCDVGYEFSCYPPGLYEISLNFVPGGLSQYAEFLVVNQWVPLSGSVSDTMIGAEKHFYSVSAPGSLSVSLSISSGPALKFIVFDGCMASASFSETQVCASDCNIWIPTEAKHSDKSTYYIELESHSIVDIDQYAPNDNTEVEKTTSYTISSKVGTGNCAAPPSKGFCASTDFEGVNVWSSITTASVWSFVDPVAKDNEAKCRFESYLTGCAAASAQCRSWLKVYSCLTSFPQCDASGFQTGICTDVCNQVAEYCGDIGLNCCSDQFVDSVQGSTCYNIPPPPPPTTASELPELGDLGFDEFPPSLDTPVFSTIQVYLPPADSLFENIPLLKEAVVGQDVSPASLLVPGLVFLLVLGLF